MDMKIVRVLFKIGNFFALTPSSPDTFTSTFLEKVHTVLTFALFTAGSIAGLYIRWPSYVQLPATKFVLRLILDSVFYCHNCDSILGVMIFKRSTLLKLFKNLKRVEYQVDSRSYFNENPHFFVFFLVQMVELASTVLFDYMWVSVMGWDFLKMYIVENFQIYTQFFHVFFAYVVLRMLLARYRHLTDLMREKIAKLSSSYNSSILDDLNSFKRRLFILKRSVGDFNYIFGWTLLTFIFYGVVTNLIYMDTIIKSKDEEYKDRTTAWIVMHSVYHLIALGSFWVGFITIAVLCDLILNEHNEIITLSYKLEIAVKKLQLDKTYDISGFIAAVSEYKPIFTAARFFTVDRSAIFSVLNSITTFLLVLIQFKPAA